MGATSQGVPQMRSAKALGLNSETVTEIPFQEQKFPRSSRRLHIRSNRLEQPLVFAVARDFAASPDSLVARTKCWRIDFVHSSVAAVESVQVALNPH